jgi:hypothetical protein
MAHSLANFLAYGWEVVGILTGIAAIPHLYKKLRKKMKKMQKRREIQKRHK